MLFEFLIFIFEFIGYVFCQCIDMIRKDEFGTLIAHLDMKSDKLIIRHERTLRPYIRNAVVKTTSSIATVYRDR